GAGLAASLLLAFFGWRWHSERVLRERIYRIGWEEDPPNMFTGDDGRPAGFGVDLVNEAARRRGIRLEWVFCPESSERALRSGKVDLWPTMTVLQERRPFVYFSAPYLNNYMKFVVRKDSGLRRVEDLRGRRIATKDLPINIAKTRQWASGALVVPVPTTKVALSMLATGAVDAMMGDDMTISMALMQGALKEGVELSEIDTEVPPFQLAIGASFEARQAADALRTEIEQMALGGELASILTRWGRATIRDAHEMALLLRALRQVERLRLAATVLAALLLLSVILFAAYRRQRRTAAASEQARREAQQRLTLVADSLTEMILAYDMQGRLTYANPAAERLTGRPAEELAALGFGCWIHPREKERLERRWKRCFEGHEFHLAPYRLLTKGGHTRWMAASWGPIWDESGRQIGVRGSERDITDLVEAQAEARQLAEAVRQASDSVVITDRNGTILFVNPAFERVTGYRREEAIGKNPRILKSGRQSQEFYRELWETILSGRSWTGRFENRRKDGSIFLEQCTISPVFNQDSDIEYFVAVKRDITQEIALAEQVRQAQKMESIGKLAGGVAHDFNNLLTVINGNCQLALMQTGSGHPARSRLEAALAAGDRAAELTRQLLAFSRRQPSQPERLDIGGTLEKMAPILNSLLGEGCELHFEIAPGLPPVLMDAAQFQQVILNLCVNARDAMQGKGRISIKAWGNHSRIFLEVSDTGPGIPPEIASQIFEPFFTTKPKGQGTGLGLSVVYGIITQSGGSIEVLSRQGEGASFLIRLPAADGAPETRKEAPDEAAGALNLRVLLVEDQPEVRRFVSEVLRQAGCHVFEAEGAEEAMQVASRAGELHLLLTDVSMPGMDGEELAHVLTRSHPQMRVLLMSGYPKRNESLSWPVLAKPFSPERLITEIRSAVAAQG
ncbi:MAG: PAS domain S-box protein, partial [Bryobacteraceae bacterium]|nr:PAS domain S-box protein [Bryobacteraceae bacterium]